MERNNAAERAAWLRAQIAENSDLYYNSDAPKISDFEYDAMFEELRSIEAAFPELDSPAQHLRSPYLYLQSKQN